MQTRETMLLFATLVSLVTQASSAVCPDCSTLPQVVSYIKTKMPKRASEDWVAPPQAALDDFQAATAAMLAGTCTGSLPTSLAGLYAREVFKDSTNDREYCLLASVSPAAPWGTVIVYGGAGAKNLSILAPHALHDSLTGDQGVHVFRGTGARAFVMTGAHRHANTVDSPCQSSYSVADAAHNTENGFQAATIAIKSHFEGPGDHTAIQFHGMADSTCGDVSAYLTNSVQVPPQENEKIDLLRDAITATILENEDGEEPVFTVNGDSPSCSLHGTTNVQGRLFNNVAAGSVCKVSSVGYSGDFIHVEQKKWVREAAQRENWVAAINSVDFASAVPPRSVAITAPAAGPVGLATTVRIRWTSFGVVGNVKLTLNDDGEGKSVEETIALSIADTGSFDWLVPGSVATSDAAYVIRVRSEENVAVKSYSEPLTFFNPVTILTPNGGGQLRVGDEVNVTWTAPGVGPVKVALCKGTTFYKDMVVETENDGHFLWTVPASVDTSYTLRFIVGMFQRNDQTAGHWGFSNTKSKIHYTIMPDSQQ